MYGVAIFQVSSIFKAAAHDKCDQHHLKQNFEVFFNKWAGVKF